MNERHHIVVSLLNSHFIITTFEILPTLKHFSLSVCCKPFSFLSFDSTLLSILMAKSSSNGDPCDCAIHIIKALPVDQNIKGVLIPLESRHSSSFSASTSSRCGLGPYLVTYLEELTLVFPFHPHFASSYQRKQMKWGEWDTFATLVTWYRMSDSWSTWVSRLAPTKLDKWKMLGINEAIHASKYDIPINPSLLIALINF